MTINYITALFRRRGARAVEWGGLENRCGGDSTQGSNPCLSAILDAIQELRNRNLELRYCLLIEFVFILRKILKGNRPFSQFIEL